MYPIYHKYSQNVNLKVLILTAADNISVCACVRACMRACVRVRMHVHMCVRMCVKCVLGVFLLFFFFRKSRT